jgi:signal transduction histidine kinase
VYILAQQRAQLCELVDELRRAKSDLEASAAQTEELAALRERTRLSREMHDSIGHALVVVNVKLEAAQRLYARESRRGDAELEETRALVRETMAELRRSLADLRAPLPNHANLAAALRCTAAEIEARSTLAVNVQAPEYLRLPPETSEAFWRVGREALSNVERHAAAASASVQLEQINGKLVLRIIDDGSGIRQADLARSGHYGVMGMRERIVALGGTLQITARHEGGTIVEASVPIKTDE